MTTVSFTIAPTEAPTYPMTPGYDDDSSNENGVWVMLWVCTMVIFIVLPFCTSRRRRELFMQGIRERRWINDDEWELSEEDSAGRQERRQQQQEETQRRFQTTRTQEDEIRQQYLSYLMENYTMVSYYIVHSA